MKRPNFDILDENHDVTAYERHYTSSLLSTRQRRNSSPAISTSWPQPWSRGQASVRHPRIRAGVKYVLSNTNTNTNTFFSRVSNTNTNTNTPAKIWSNTNTNTNTAHQIQIQIQIHNEAETKLPPFYRWHIEIYCIVRRLFIHSNFTENCFQRSNLQ